MLGMDPQSSSITVGESLPALKSQPFSPIWLQLQLTLLGDGADGTAQSAVQPAMPDILPEHISFT